MKIVFLFLVLISTAVSYNYLVLCPLYAHSHHKFLAKISDTLTDAGHNVTFLAPIIVRKYENVKYLESTKDIVYIQPSIELENMGFTADYSMFWDNDATAIQFAPAVQRFMRMFQIVYENLKKDTSVLDDLRNRNFDAIVYEILCPVAYPIAEYLNIKTLLPSLSMTHHTLHSRIIGEPSHPSVVPSMISSFGDDMTFSERLQSTITDIFFTLFVNAPPMTSLKDHSKKIDIDADIVRAPFVFLNANPYLDYPRPLLTKSVLIGGISVNATQMRMEKLNEKYNQILNRREKTVLISFGSMIFSKDMPADYKQTIIRVIQSFPNVTFIWKYEDDNVDFAKNVENVHFSKWVPQTALLADSRLSAFVTHAGMGSVTELSYMGKPALLIPIFADQLRNAKTLSRHNGSITLSKYDLRIFSNLRDAVEEILTNEQYKLHAETLAQQLADQPVSPHTLLVKHAEFGAKFGELPNLDPYSRQMSFFTFYMIDIILFIVAVLSFLLITTVWAVRWAIGKMCVKKQKKQ